MTYPFFKITALLICASCNLNNGATQINVPEEHTKSTHLEISKNTIGTRFLPPKGYQRTSSPTPFHAYMLKLPLKDFAEPVLYFNGNAKPQNGVYCSVIKLEIGTKDLHQCADACIRLRADFLYQSKQYDKIKFNYLSDHKPRYYVDYAKGNYSYDVYWKYLEQIFSYANTASLFTELPTVTDLNKVQVGDLLLQKKTPYGHAVIVVDMVENNKGENLVLLAQSYMPAQELQILNNPSNPDLSPWYQLKNGTILTPEWEFSSQDWKTWTP